MSSSHYSARFYSNHMMPSLLSKPFEFLFLSPLLLFIFHLPTCIPQPLTTVCPNTANYTTNSTFGTNLNLLLSSLSTNASLTGYSNNTIGDNPNRIYGLAQCRGDNTPDKCRDCLNTASEEIIASCPNRTAIIWYERCLLRYSNQPVSSSYENTPWFSACHYLNASDRDRFNLILGQMLNGLASTAAFGPSKRMYASKETNFTIFQKIHVVVQCTNDLSRNACNECLKGAVGHLPEVCNGKIGGKVIGPSCYLRFEMYKFYDDLPIETAPSRDDRKATKIAILASVTAFIGLAILGSSLYYCKWGRKRPQRAMQGHWQGALLDDLGPLNTTHAQMDGESLVDSHELPWIDLATVRLATNSFSEANKLGQGGFGPVYKGVLPDGKEIAVKRLSRSSGQGLEELKNEVRLIAKLQHRNLVRLLFCCIDRVEKLLIYEYLPNTSLDVFLFGSNKCAQLNWEKRLQIVGGIARGLLYLHEDSRLRIIHRDLKPSNVLLDHEMNPKISDFGMARIFGGNQSQGSTKRVVGTYGYMAPEYAMAGLFSVKSDVFSFGVLLLEIVSGKKNTYLHFPGDAQSLLTYAWRPWCEGKCLELIDSLITEACPTEDVLRCIHIGLLCVQENAANRPTMSSVVVMLKSDPMTLPQPTQPGFFVGRAVIDSNQLSGGVKPCSTNGVTISNIEPR